MFLMQRGEHVGQALCNLGNSVETFLTESMSDCLSLSGFFFQAIHTHTHINTHTVSSWTDIV